MDIWGLGCVFFEILALGPLFPGSDEIDEINRINSIAFEYQKIINRIFNGN